MTCVKGVFDEAARQCREVQDSSEYQMKLKYIHVKFKAGTKL